MSIKQEIENALILTAVQEFFYKSDSDSENSDFENETEENDLITSSLLLLSETRYFNTHLYNIPKSSH